jgi:hypothetical protein
LSTAAAVLLVGVLGGAAAGLYINRYLPDSIARSAVIGGAVALSGVLLASLLAFFGSVLNLLAEIAEHTTGQVPVFNGAVRPAGAANRAGLGAISKMSLNSAANTTNRGGAPPAVATIPEELRDDLGAWLSW